MDADALGRGQVVDTPPAHLQEDEGDEEPPFLLACTVSAQCYHLLSVVFLQRVGGADIICMFA